jgi:putative hydrolase of the HAD superfamily
MKTIIFDFGNVVGFFDHGRTLRGLEQYTDMTGPEIIAQVYASQLGEDFESGRIDGDAFLGRFLKECRLTCTAEVLTDLCSDIFWPNPEICELIPRLKPRYQILLGSNTNILHARRFRAQFAEVLSHFDHLVLSHEIGQRKPGRAFFEHCQTLARGAPQECIFVDDLTANVESACTLGWKGIVYQPNDGVLDKLRAAGVEV